MVLLEHGAPDVGAWHKNHSTPLHAASHVGGSNAVQILLEHGANVHVRNNRGFDDGTTPTTDTNQIDIIRLEHGLDVGAVQHRFIWVSGKGSLKAVQIVLERGANLHVERQS
jgi:Ankyrin repeats (many copies)